MRYILATALLLILGGVWVAGQRVAPPNRGGASFSLTTSGTSGASTYVGGVLNIPVYAGTTYTGTPPIVISGSAISVSNATSSTVGVIKPDNSTCSVSAGVLTCVGSSGLSVGPSGALSIVAGVIDGVSSVIAYLANANPWTGKNTFQQGIFTYGAPTGLTGFGTSPSISSASGPGGGRITVGTGNTATTGSVTWAISPSVAPACTANDETTILLVQAAATTSGLTLTSASHWTAGDTLTYTCTGLSTTLP